MKITKRQLRRIIKEEKSKLTEQQFTSPDADDIIDGFYNAFMETVWEDWSATGVDPHDPVYAEEIEYVKQALRNLLTDFEAGNF